MLPRRLLNRSPSFPHFSGGTHALVWENDPYFWELREINNFCWHKEQLMMQAVSTIQQTYWASLVWFPDPSSGGEREGSGELPAACTDPRLHSSCLR